MTDKKQDKKPPKQEKGEGEIGNELDKDADNHPSSPETPRAREKTCDNCARKPCSRVPAGRKKSCPQHKPAPKETDRMTECKEVGHPYHTCPVSGTPVKCVHFNTEGCIKCVLSTKNAEIDALTQKVKDLEADNIKLQEGTLKIIEEQGTRIAEFEAERQSVIALKSRIELLSTGLQKWHKRATDLEAELKKKDDGLKKIKRWSENNLGQDAQEIIGKTVNKLLKDAPKKKVKK